MTGRPSFCSEIRNVVCNSCTLLEVGESTWKKAVQPNSTPYWTANGVRSELDGIRRGGDEADAILLARVELGNQVDDSAAVRTVALDVTRGDLVQGLQDNLLPGGDYADQLARDFPPDPGNEAPTAVVLALAGCVAHQITATCKYPPAS
jgi:hypothetical protein